VLKSNLEEVKQLKYQLTLATVFFLSGCGGAEDGSSNGVWLSDIEQFQMSQSNMERSIPTGAKIIRVFSRPLPTTRNADHTFAIGSQFTYRLNDDCYEITIHGLKYENTHEPTPCELEL